MKWEDIFQLGDIKTLYYLQDRGESRYSELLRNIGMTRGALASTLRDLRRRGLVERSVEATTPIQTKYRLTAKGRETVQKLRELQQLVQ